MKWKRRWKRRAIELLEIEAYLKAEIHKKNEAWNGLAESYRERIDHAESELGWWQKEYNRLHEEYADKFNEAYENVMKDEAVAELKRENDKLALKLSRIAQYIYRGVDPLEDHSDST